jgi:hypothetical protein
MTKGPTVTAVGPFTRSVQLFHFGVNAGILGLSTLISTGAINLTSPTDDVFTELERRHKAVATTVLGLLVANVLLAIVAYLGKPYFRQTDNPSLETILKVGVGLLAIGAIIWRRMRLAPMRLKDIGTIQGGSGLIRTLEKTTLQIAVLTALMAALGFVATALSGNEYYNYFASAVAILLLVYFYPRKSSWMRTVQSFTE